MKILAIVPYLSPIYGGTSKSVTEITQAIGNHDVSIDLVTTNANDNDKLDLPINTWIKEKSYRVRYFDCWHKYDFVFSFPLLIWLHKNIKEYDLVHTHTVFTPQILLVQWICQINGIPYISTPHGMLEPWALSHKAWKKSIYYNLLEQSALKKAKAIQGIASTETHNLKTLGFEHTFIVSNGISPQDYGKKVNLNLFYAKFPQVKNKTTILFLGRIDPKKGLDLLASAFSRIHKLFPQAHLVVGGPDSIGFLDQAKKFFADLGCLEAVTFTGMLDGDFKLAALAAANIYIAPSYSEGFSMSVLEGMASGLPCIITTGCNFPEAAEAKVAHVVDINGESIAQALTVCLQNPSEAEQMGIRAGQFILNNYTWDIVAQKLIEVYQTSILSIPDKISVRNKKIDRSFLNNIRKGV